jgi:hypothetical protein
MCVEMNMSVRITGSLFLFLGEGGLLFVLRSLMENRFNFCAIFTIRAVHRRSLDWRRIALWLSAGKSAQRETRSGDLLIVTRRKAPITNSEKGKMAVHEA